jgi:hypothetical protein
MQYCGLRPRVCTIADAVLKRGACVALLVCGWSLDAAASISVSPSPLDAGTSMVGTPTSADGTLTSTTNVHVDLKITTACSGGGGTFEFATDTNINLNSPAMISVTYTPTLSGTRSCRVDVYDTGTTTVLGSFNVRGTGLDPPTQTTAGNPAYGAVRWNDAAPVHTVTHVFTVSNTGDLPLDVTASIGGTNASDFTITSPAAQSVPAGGAKNWTVVFDPDAGGNRTATLTFDGNDPKKPAGDSFTLTGAGTNAVISVPATTFDYGIINVGSSQPADVTITNIGAAPKGNLGVTSASISDPNNSGWFSFAGSCSGQSCTFSPALSIQTSQIVTVRCAPPLTATATMVQTATVTFVSDTDNGSPANTASLRCTAGKSSLSTNQNVITFGSARVMTTTAGSTVTITNTGNVGTTYYLVPTGTNQAQFTLSTQSGCGTSATNQCPIAAMGMSSFSVVFKPTGEGDISAGVTIVVAGSSNVQVTLVGRGIDNHIQMIDAAQFPDTFRHPGEMATVMPIAVKNIGEYPLSVSAVMLEGAPIWTLAEPFQPFVVPGLGSVNINVKFQPETAGKMPDGVLVVISDDTKAVNPLPTVVISGNGKDRNIEVRGPIDFGNTGAGVPINLTQIKAPADWLTVHNLDDTAFKIREITSDMPDVFKIQTLSGDKINNRELAVDGTEQFEIVFLPPKVGDYNADIKVFLDEDPTSQRTIQVHGNALFVDAHGGGGCSTGRGAGGGVLLAFAALLRRKRRRA